MLSFLCLLGWLFLDSLSKRLEILHLQGRASHIRYAGVMSDNLNHSLPFLGHFIFCLLEFLHALLLVFLLYCFDVLMLCLLFLLLDMRFAFLHPIDLVDYEILDLVLQSSLLFVEDLFGLLGLFDDFEVLKVFYGRHVGLLVDYCNGMRYPICPARAYG